MDLQCLLEVAANVCVTAHTGQRDKGGKAYFLHPMRVAMRCKKDEEKIVALLHDTIEDGNVTEEYLFELGFPQNLIDAVVSVTKQDGESYEDFIARAKENPIGRTVKILDIEDNLDASRIEMFSSEMASYFTKYVAALNYLRMEDNPKVEVKKFQTINDLYKTLRQQENSSIRQRAHAQHTGGTNYMYYRLIIRDKDKTIIDESSIFDTLCKIGKIVGFDTLADSNITVSKGKYNYHLVKSNTDSNYYKIYQNWFILANVPVISVAIALNEFFDLTESRLIASIVNR